MKTLSPEAKRFKASVEAFVKSARKLGVPGNAIEEIIKSAVPTMIEVDLQVGIDSQGLSHRFAPILSEYSAHTITTVQYTTAYQRPMTGYSAGND